MAGDPKTCTLYVAIVCGDGAELCQQWTNPQVPGAVKEFPIERLAFRHGWYFCEMVVDRVSSRDSSNTRSLKPQGGTGVNSWGSCICLSQLWKLIHCYSWARKICAQAPRPRALKSPSPSPSPHLCRTVQNYSAAVRLSSSRAWYPIQPP